MGTVDLRQTEDGVAVLELDGAIDLRWTEQMLEHASALRADPGVRAVLIASEGRMFCPGGDLHWMAAQPDPGEAIGTLAGTLHAGLRQLRAVDAPIVARVNGAAAGAGLSLVMAADLAIAGASASFTVAYAGVGLSPDGGASWLLPRLVGRRRAAELMLTNRRVAADEAERIGLVTRTVPDDELVAEADALVERLAGGPTASYGAMKRLLDRSSQMELGDQLDAEATAIVAAASSPTGQEGIAAFVAKRRPAFPRHEDRA